MVESLRPPGLDLWNDDASNSVMLAVIPPVCIFMFPMRTWAVVRRRESHTRCPVVGVGHPQQMAMCASAHHIMCSDGQHTCAVQHESSIRWPESLRHGASFNMLRTIVRAGKVPCFVLGNAIRHAATSQCTAHFELAGAKERRRGADRVALHLLPRP